MIINLNDFRNPVSYQHGFCHLVSLAFSIVFDTKSTLAMDTEAYDDNFNIIQEDCLIHAFSTLPNGSFFDAEGVYDKEEYQSEYDVILSFEFNNHYFKKLSYQELFLFINENYDSVDKQEILALSDLIYDLFCSSFSLSDRSIINSRIFNLFI